MAPPEDPGWKYCRKVDKKDQNKLICIYCSKELKGGIWNFRVKQHLVGGFRNAKGCLKCPPEVKEELKEYMIQKASSKEDSQAEKNYERDRVCLEGEFPKSKSVTSKAHNSSAAGSTQGAGPSTKENPPIAERKGPLDIYYAPNPEVSVKKQGKKDDADQAARKQLRDRACKYIARWIYEAEIAFSAVNYMSFNAVIEAIGQYGPGMKPSLFHEVRVPLLKQEVETTHEIVEEHKTEWSKTRASIVCDG